MHRLKALAVSAVLAAGAFGGTAISASAPAGALTTVAKPAKLAVPHYNRTARATPVRQHKLTKLTGVGGVPDSTHEVSKTQPEPGGATPKHAAGKAVHPQRAQTSVGSAAPASAFQGVNHWQQSVGSRHTIPCPSPYASTGDVCTASNFSFEPPDQQMCSGGLGGSASTPGILEGVNDALSLYNASGVAMAGPETINDFFGLTPQLTFVVGSGGLVDEIAGSVIATDPRCMYDTVTGRYVVLMLGLPVTPGSLFTVSGAGQYTGHSSLYWAISDVNDPLDWTTFSMDISDDGCGGSCPSNPNCPCLGDQPLMGFNADAFYFATNEYPFIPGGVGRGFFYNGPQWYVLDRTTMALALAGTGNQAVQQIDLGTTSPSYTQFNGLPCPFTDPTFGQACLFYSTEPAQTAPGVTAPGGVENFLSTGDLWGFATGEAAFSGDDTIWSFQLTGTNTYNASCATACNSSDLVGFYSHNDSSGVGTGNTAIPYALPPNEACVSGSYYNPGGINNCARQKPALAQYLPLATQCQKVPAGIDAPCPEAGIATNDSRMEQVYQDGNGKVWSAFTTLYETVTSTNTYDTAGVEWVEVTPINLGTDTAAQIVNDGLTGSRYYDVFFPSVVAGNNGHAQMGLDIAGPTIFPSVGYQVLGTGAAPGGVWITYQGPRPEDGFAAYQVGYQRPRWGDYSGSVLDVGGHFWMAGESTSVQRTTLANWSTEVFSTAGP